MKMGSYSVHGESITDGNASGGVAVTLYDSGSTDVRTLLTTEVLYVTDARIQCETGADVFLVADSKAAGRYVVHGTVDAKGGVILHFSKPYACPKGKGLKFYGAATNINSCLIEGFIREA
jgi:uncharacterized protein (DUF1684 family)